MSVIVSSCLEQIYSRQAMARDSHASASQFDSSHLRPSQASTRGETINESPEDCSSSYDSHRTIVVHCDFSVATLSELMIDDSVPPSIKAGIRFEKTTILN
jgi:hypothetical protein